MDIRGVGEVYGMVGGVMKALPHGNTDQEGRCMCALHFGLVGRGMDGWSM